MVMERDPDSEVKSMAREVLNTKPRKPIQAKLPPR